MAPFDVPRTRKELVLRDDYTQVNTLLKAVQIYEMNGKKLPVCAWKRVIDQDRDEIWFAIATIEEKKNDLYKFNVRLRYHIDGDDYFTEQTTVLSGSLMYNRKNNRYWADGKWHLRILPAPVMIYNDEIDLPLPREEFCYASGTGMLDRYLTVFSH